MSRKSPVAPISLAKFARVSALNDLSRKNFHHNGVDLTIRKRLFACETLIISAQRRSFIKEQRKIRCDDKEKWWVRNVNEQIHREGKPSFSLQELCELGQRLSGEASVDL